MSRCLTALSLVWGSLAFAQTDPTSALTKKWCQDFKPNHSICGSRVSHGSDFYGTYEFLGSDGTKENEFLKEGATGVLYVSADNQFLRIYQNPAEKFKARPIFGNAGRIEANGWHAKWLIGVFNDGGMQSSQIALRDRKWDTKTTKVGDVLQLKDTTNFNESWRARK